MRRAARGAEGRGTGSLTSGNGRSADTSTAIRKQIRSPTPYPHKKSLRGATSCGPRCTHGGGNDFGPLLPEKRDHTIDDVIQWHRRAKAREALQLGTRGPPPVHILEPGLIGLFVAHMRYRGSAARTFPNPFSQCVDGDFVIRADVHH